PTPPICRPFPYTTLFRSGLVFSLALGWKVHGQVAAADAAKLRENRGKQIYIQGTSRAGKEILAYLGESSLEVQGSAMPCANCHRSEEHTSELQSRFVLVC